MKALDLDFRRPAVPAGRWLGGALLGAALLALAVVAQRHHELSNQQRAAQARSALLDKHLRDVRPARSATPADAVTLARIKRANAIVDQLAVPWDELFDAFEAADSRPLGLLAMTPNARDRSLRVAGEARATGDLLAYVARVAAQPAFSQVHLVNYSTVVRDGAPVVVFTLSASWRIQP